MSARENIIGRIRAALGKSADPARNAAVKTNIQLHAPGPRPQAQWNLLERFRERALNLSSSVDEISALEQLPQAVARYLREKNLPPQAVCWPEFSALDWAAQGISVAARAAQGNDAVGITAAFCAIAETGSLVLLSGKDTPAATSLLPETHIAVVKAERIVIDMEQTWGLLRSERAEVPRAINFVSGPSRTADIEQTVTLGAHGPYRVHIVLIA
ncbi:MAG: LutC/YkgG family protein [Burkholderiales bacterium]